MRVESIGFYLDLQEVTDSIRRGANVITRVKLLHGIYAKHTPEISDAGHGSPHGCRGGWSNVSTESRTCPPLDISHVRIAYIRWNAACVIICLVAYDR